MQSEGNFEGGVREGEGGGGKQKPPQHWQSKKKKRSAKTTPPFARSGKMLTTLSIYIYIYNII